MSRLGRPVAVLLALALAVLALAWLRRPIAEPRAQAPRAVWLSPAYGGGRVMLGPASAGAQPEILAEHPAGILDYAIHPRGSAVAILIAAGSGQANLLIQPVPRGSPLAITVCATQLCSGPAWSFDGAYLAFDAADPGDPDRARLWVHDAATGIDSPVRGQPEGGFRSAHWAPTGHVLAGFSPALSEVRVLDLDSGAQSAVAARAGELLAWAPDGHRLVYGHFEFAGERPLHRLMLLDLREGASRPVTEPAAEPITSVAWAPSGDRVAFSQSSGAGREVRVLDLASERVRVLLAARGATFGGLAWSPIGQDLLAVRAMAGTPSSPPGVWSIRVDSGEARMLAPDATLPGWLLQH